ncbi:hypothetical protein QUV83_08880 [Cellulomonas cellasea]|uniref:hypothetical protein n=1 Tax=Cellulomonas cellasea TaxID=43670 RepID=UPI0025A31DFD|nr:hypothetical protein [Cellulomonas cellasea]MDM8084876.1 hypothetical protein [Cellulomonas cellasea]
MPRRSTLTAALLVALALAACSGPDPEAPPVDTSRAPIDDVDTSTGEAPDTTDDGPTDALAHITSCDQVAALTGGLTDGLTLVDPSVDEWGFACLWEAPDATDLAEVRSIEVIGQPFDLRGSMTTPADIAAGGVLTQIPDATLEQAGGIAYSMRLGDVVSALAVTIQVPDAEISVGGGGWAGQTAGLDETAAVRIATAVLGL